MTRAPLRFLLAVLILWTGVRAAILLPGAMDGIAPVEAAAARPPRTLAAPPAPGPILPAMAGTSLPLSPLARRENGAENPRYVRGPKMLSPTAPNPAGSPSPSGLSAAPPAMHMPQASGFALAPPRPRPAPSSRWSLSAWLLVRDEGGGSSLAPGGTLGGSQAGARLTYALGHGFGLSARAYLPVRNAAGSEAAAGIDWRPIRAIPVNLLAERRQRLGRDGRSAFALTVYGGTSRNLARGLRIDLYGQAGVVGLHSRDLFADGALRLSRRVGPVELGAGAWGAAQPGAERLDAGPSLSWRLPIRDANLRLQADWRFRLAGEAAPHSGPTLTLAADF